MESFGGYLRIVRKRGPQPYWTPIAPVHRLFSYPLSYLYCALGLTPLAVTLLGLAVAVAGATLVLGSPLGGWQLWTGLALLNLGVVHDACDGEVARWRIHHRLQSPKTYRVGMFADFWAYAIVVQALLPAVLGYVAFQRGAPVALAWLGAAAAFMLLAAYVAGFARPAYWPGRGPSPADESFSFAAGGPPWLRLARKAYFQVFETAMFTFHATVVVGAWTVVGGAPPWAIGYVAFVGAALTAAFLVGLAQTLRRFDQEG
ncbi:MAG: hypothetical protein QOD77_1913 [Thermoplasmata archaeon]|nr:hypothetical protein [Thermoplasmata archaeon]